ncbi:MAG TPA: hypothetical protein VH475_00525, partial [Tepidisphaeraceae bacterium]
MKNLTSILLACVMGAGWLATAPVRAQQPYGDTATASPLDRARGDLDDARRRESDLAGQVASQERANAALRDQMRRADAGPNGLAKDLADASADAAGLRKRVADQKGRRDTAQDRLNDARGRALDRLEDTEPMRAARKAIEDAGGELERLSQPIFERLTQTPDYQEAQALVDAAAQTGEALQGFAGADPKAQAEADAAFDQAMGSLRAMEDAAVDADPKAAAAHKAFKSAEEALNRQRQANEARVGADPAVDGARFALDAEQKSLDDISAQLATAEKRLSALRQAVDPQAGGVAELTRQLKDGEDRLVDLNDRLDQARIARQDTEDRLRAVEGAIAGRTPGAAEPYDGGVAPPPTYDPGYSDGG